MHETQNDVSAMKGGARDAERERALCTSARPVYKQGAPPWTTSRILCHYANIRPEGAPQPSCHRTRKLKQLTDLSADDLLNMAYLSSTGEGPRKEWDTLIRTQTEVFAHTFWEKVVGKRCSGDVAQRRCTFHTLLTEWLKPKPRRRQRKRADS